MKELLIFRTFTLFPLIGTLVPDIANKFNAVPFHIPAGHIIVEITLTLCIIICSLGIWATEHQTVKQAEVESAW